MLESSVIAGQQPRWGLLFLFAILASFGHILLDYVTAYGVRPFEPFNFRWYSYDIVSIIEPLWLAAMAAALVFPIFLRTGQRRSRLTFSRTSRTRLGHRRPHLYARALGISRLPASPRSRGIEFRPLQRFHCEPRVGVSLHGEPVHLARSRRHAATSTRRSRSTRAPARPTTTESGHTSTNLKRRRSPSPPSALASARYTSIRPCIP